MPAALLPLIAVLLAGIGIAVQAPTNAALAKTSGSVVLAALVSFLVGALLLAAAWAAFDRTAPAALKGTPGWAWLGGVYGAGFVAAMAYAAPAMANAAPNGSTSATAIETGIGRRARARSNSASPNSGAARTSRPSSTRAGRRRRR